MALTTYGKAEPITASAMASKEIERGHKRRQVPGARPACQSLRPRARTQCLSLLTVTMNASSRLF